MRQKLICILLIITIIITFTGCGKFELFLNVKKGDLYKTNYKSEGTLNVELSGSEITSVQNSETQYSLDVLDVDSDGNVKMKYTYDSVKSETKSVGMNVSYDSKNVDENNPMSKFFSGIVGKGFTTEMDRIGNIKKIEGVDNLYDDMLNSIGSGEDMRDQIDSFIKDSYTEGAIKSAIGVTTNIYPEGIVKKGAAWTRAIEIEKPIRMKMNAIFTLEKDGFSKANVKVNAKLDIKKGEKVSISGIEAKVDITGEMNGNVEFNKSNGFINKGNLVQELNGNINANVRGFNIEAPADAIFNITFSTEKK